jgi:uncharacterized protein YodC (DUF2158 family)
MNSHEEFEPETGNVVRLKSGGPRMTVIESDGKAVRCVWFPNEFSVQDHTFPVNALEVA